MNDSDRNYLRKVLPKGAPISEGVFEYGFYLDSGMAKYRHAISSLAGRILRSWRFWFPFFIVMPFFSALACSLIDEASHYPLFISLPLFTSIVGYLVGFVYLYLTTRFTDCLDFERRECRRSGGGKEITLCKFEDVSNVLLQKYIGKDLGIWVGFESKGGHKVWITRFQYSGNTRLEEISALLQDILGVRLEIVTKVSVYGSSYNVFTQRS